ncbi:MAG: MFS transporter [Actinobacteria bacterium]|nr:MFS transporter [Actinomycetota bacterium]
MFQRDRVFWLGSLQASLVVFFVGGFGPAQPLLRIEQQTSLAIAGLHGTAMGIASIAAGFTGPVFVHRFGRPRTTWIGMGIFLVGLIAFVFAPAVQFTLIATLIAGFGTSTVINAMVTRFTEHFRENASNALSQGNAVGSIGYILGTFSVGTLAAFGISWRLALLAVIPVAIFLYSQSRHEISDEHTPDESGPQRGALSGKFWFAWFGFVACIAGEFATTFWAAALIRDRIGSSPAFSTITIMAVGTGMGLGRWYGPKVLKRFQLDSKLKFVIALQFFAFSVVWFSHTLLISLIALCVVGMGLSMQFPLSSLRLIGFSDNRPDLAIGRSSLAAGSAIAGSPFILGVLGDYFGISRAYLMVPVLVILAFSTLVILPSQKVTVGENL